MNTNTLMISGYAPPLLVASQFLQEHGISVTNRPAMDVTHLLLPVPSFETDGRIRGGGVLAHILGELPEDITVIGGNLDLPILAGYRKVDLLKDPLYLHQNAAITAYCALTVAAKLLPVTFSECPTLVVGWGRIGKLLSKHLAALGTPLTVAARKPADLSLANALGLQAVSIDQIPDVISNYRLIFNTVPAPVISSEAVANCRNDCVKIELASKPGIAGSDVVSALGLPGKMASESSGMLIGQSVLRLAIGKEDAG